MGISTVFTGSQRASLFYWILVLGLLGTLSVHAAHAADKVRIGYSGATVSNAMLWVTEEEKLFKKNGIDPQILYLQTTLGQTAMIAGEIDMCVYSGSLLPSARLQGADVVLNRDIHLLHIDRERLRRYPLHRSARQIRLH